MTEANLVVQKDQTFSVESAASRDLGIERNVPVGGRVERQGRSVLPLLGQRALVVGPVKLPQRQSAAANNDQQRGQMRNDAAQD